MEDVGVKCCQLTKLSTQAHDNDQLEPDSAAGLELTITDNVVQKKRCKIALNDGWIDV